MKLLFPSPATERQRRETETEKGGAVSVPISVSFCSVLLTPGFHPGYNLYSQIASAPLIRAVGRGKQPGRKL